MRRTDWNQYTSVGEVHARARGRASVNVTRRTRAEVRRLTIAKRLPALRDEAWVACPEGTIPRVVTGGILGTSVQALAQELGVSESTIEKDLQVIEAQDLRRLELASRLPSLREEARAQGAKGEPPRLPKAMVYALAKEFRVKGWVIRRDIAAIDASTPRPRLKTVRDQRWRWAYERPRQTQLPRRLTVRFSEETYQRLIATESPMRVIRQAVEIRLNSGSHHTADECALIVAQACDPATQDRLVRTAERLGIPLAQVLASILLVHSNTVQH